MTEKLTTTRALASALTESHTSGKDAVVTVTPDGARDLANILREHQKRLAKEKEAEAKTIAGLFWDMFFIGLGGIGASIITFAVALILFLPLIMSNLQDNGVWFGLYFFYAYALFYYMIEKPNDR